jgi:hypothetical protein
MHFLDNFLKGIFSEYKILREYENDCICEIEYSSSEMILVNPEILEKSLSFLSSRDTFVCTVTFGESDPISYYSDKPKTTEFIKELAKEYEHQMDESIHSKITITKQIIDGHCTIYSLKSFTNTLKSLTGSQCFSIFSRIFSKNDFIIFNVNDLDITFKTSTIQFTSLENKTIFQPQEARNIYIESFQSACFHSNNDTINLTPVDFILEEESYIPIEVQELFNLYAAILSIIYLFDITNLQGNKLDFKINGYKSIKGEVDLLSFKAESNKESNCEYIEIFKWVYKGGNINDKIGLARNIISLHFSKNGELNLHGYPFQSIRSSYKVYEKQNINRYIEVRNKISDQLLDFNNRANKIVETFASGFQKSALTLTSFYISALVIRVLSKGDFKNIFSFDTTILSLVFILGSFIYYLVSQWEISEQRKRFINSYFNLKQRYNDLLEENDIKLILNNDKDFNEDLSFIDNKKKIYSRMWLSFLSILFISTLVLFAIYTINQILDSFITKYIF